MAFVGTDTSSLLEILGGPFGHLYHLPPWRHLPRSQLHLNQTSEAPEKTPITPSDDGGLVSAELVFPLKSILLIITGLPKSFLPLHGPETLSWYRCQYPSCTLEFLQKAAACNHVCIMTTLNLALACLYLQLCNHPKNAIVQCFCLGASYPQTCTREPAYLP